MKKEFKPKYYLNFSCIADKCKHSCCKLWEIDVDEYSIEKYEEEYPEILESIEEIQNGSEIEYQFKMNQERSCIHLKENGLCSLICDHGQDIIPDNCFQHPRFIHIFPSRVEYGMGLCCEEVARMVLDSDIPFEYVENTDYDIHDIGEVEDSEEELEILADFESFDEYRKELASKVLSDEIKLEDLLIYTPSECIEILNECEILDSNWKKYITYLNEESFSTLFEFSQLFKKLICYYIYRFDYEMDILKLKRFVNFVLCTIWNIASGIKGKYGCISKEELLEICREFSAEIEYSTENPDIIFAKGK